MYRGLTPHKPFGLEPLGIELEAKMLRAERFKPPTSSGFSTPRQARDLRHAKRTNTFQATLNSRLNAIVRPLIK